MSFRIQTLRRVNSKQGRISHMWDQTTSSIKWYCETTSLHGFHYVTSKHSSIFTRMFFAFASCCSFILCSYLIVLQLFQHQEQSILTTVRSTAYPVWRIRFPAVTICNFNVVYKDNIKNVFNAVKTRGIKETVFMNFVHNLSSLIVHHDFEDMNSYQEVFVALQRSGYTADRLMAELAHPCNNMVRKCFWQSEEVTCAHIFQSIKTSQGYCCSFNYYGMKDATHNTNDTRGMHHHLVGGAGPTLGLRLLLDIEKEQYISSIRPSSNGLNILVQDGADYPDMDLMSNTLLSAEELTISVAPRIYDSSENIRGVNVKERNCLFEDEGNLEWSSTYSFKTCISQCRAEAISKYCNCIPYYYPVAKNIRFCTLLDITCLQNYKFTVSQACELYFCDLFAVERDKLLMNFGNYLNSLIPSLLIRNYTDKPASNKYNALGVTESFLTDVEMQSVRDRIDEIIQCNCYPQCNERMFDLHTDRGEAIQMKGFEYTNMSMLTVYYNTVGCIETMRDVNYTWDFVFASIGGIFGLCLGGSVISILECFYFMARCVPNCKTTKSKVDKPKEPEILYASDFTNRYYSSSFGKRVY